VLAKEFVQMRRDRLIFAMMMRISLIQLTFFYFAINTDLKNLPIAVLSADHSLFSRTLIRGLESSDYFRITHILQSEAEVVPEAEPQMMFPEYVLRILREEVKPDTEKIPLSFFLTPSLRATEVLGCTKFPPLCASH
jgi:ABC-2 type transport system permease protein